MQRLRLRRSEVPDEIPGNPGALYEPGEIAINLADGKLYYGDADGNPQEFKVGTPGYPPQLGYANVV